MLRRPGGPDIASIKRVLGRDVSNHRPSRASPVMTIVFLIAKIIGRTRCLKAFRRQLERLSAAPTGRRWRKEPASGWGRDCARRGRLRLLGKRRRQWNQGGGAGKKQGTAVHIIFR